METKLEITMTEQEAGQLGLTDDVGSRQRVVTKVVEQLGLSSDTGGWYWKLSRKEGNVKLTGRLVPAGESVVG